MAWDGKERRKYKRVSLRLLLEFDDPDAPEGNLITRMETLNFSAGGFYCCLSRQMQPLTRLALSFVFPPFGKDHESEHRIDCEAVVVRCEPEAGSPGSYRVAACFTSLIPEDRYYIEEYMNWYEAVYESDSELDGVDEEPDPNEEDDQVA